MHAFLSQFAAIERFLIANINGMLLFLDLQYTYIVSLDGHTRCTSTGELPYSSCVCTCVCVSLSVCGSVYLSVTTPAPIALVSMLTILVRDVA